MAFPEFTHIHCSSRFDRPAAVMESDMDRWMEMASLITVTEIERDQKAVTLAEKGWGYFNAKGKPGSDECGIAWKSDHWQATHHDTKQLTTRGFATTRALTGHHPPLYCCDVLLKRRPTGHKLMVSVTHMPAHVEGRWNSANKAWHARKMLYMDGMAAWNTHVIGQARKWKPDAILVCADFNLNLKLKWVHQYLSNRWSKFAFAWQKFPTQGGSLPNGPNAPAGSPGKGYHDRIIDGSLIRGLRMDESQEVNPLLLPIFASSDHRPYMERMRFAGKAGGGLEDVEFGSDPAGRGLIPGPEWWGFGDYMDDEMYIVVGGVPIYPDLYGNEDDAPTGTRQGEVL